MATNSTDSLQGTSRKRISLLSKVLAVLLVLMLIFFFFAVVFDNRAIQFCCRSYEDSIDTAST